jgi:hypothetical protein
MVSDGMASARWEGYRDGELAPALLVGMVPGTRPVRLVTALRLATMVVILCAAVMAAVGLMPSQAGRGSGDGAVAAVAGPGLPTVPLSAIGPGSTALAGNASVAIVRGSRTLARPRRRPET